MTMKATASTIVTFVMPEKRCHWPVSACVPPPNTPEKPPCLRCWAKTIIISKMEMTICNPDNKTRTPNSSCLYILSPLGQALINEVKFNLSPLRGYSLLLYHIRENKRYYSEPCPRIFNSVRIAAARCEMAFFVSAGISAKEASNPSGRKRGS